MVGLSDKEQYAVEAGLIHSQKESDRSFKYVPTLIIRTPSSTPVSVTGKLEYKPGKYIKGSGVVDVKKLLTKVIAVKGQCHQESGREIHVLKVRLNDALSEMLGNRSLFRSF